MIAGTYAHRFSGYAVVQGIPCSVVGLGTMSIQPTGAVTGRQISSATQLEGDGAVIEVGEFDLIGSLTADTGGLWKATITFTQTGGNANGPQDQVLVGTFSLVPAGGVVDMYERLWLISTGATLMTSGSNPIPLGPADEVVSGEAVRIAPLS